MITCKEDLIGTYILNDRGELREMYIKKALEFGLSVNSACLTTSSDLIFTKSQSADFGMVDHALTIEYLKRTYGAQREATLMDLKPTPTKFVKVEESIFDLKEEFERGELYSSDCEGHYTQLKCEKKLYLAAHQDSVYRQVEINWTDELGSFLAKKAFDGASVNNLDISDLNDNLGTVSASMELRFNDFIEMCHLVASLTEKPEGV
ncbi:hypothetical protein NVP1199A_14 [Vibrio phage 1.199.A._10N.286.55.C10]|nr:hypothetical protein NVP1199A_14 [Vibrio phage 1.199.A._10N.286.55.C10]AUR94957.1 hypothetical protein NVP1199B_14 [Vibrio phage 1.199.B._10N.286.55.C10]